MLFHISAIYCSIHNAVIAVFQKKGLADNELYTLNEGVRWGKTTDWSLFLYIFVNYLLHYNGNC